ncbi:MAG: dTDP-4-dehydrorhamnose reductase [Saprospiraceae bacterium]|nr:dTDP-4-dehydrorhamnose reductase [Saprospiraceae bacterium]
MNQTTTFKKLKIAILGSNGQLGQEFRFISASYEFVHFDFYSRQVLDIADADRLKNLLAEHHYDYIINCAAYTAVDKAESEAEACYAINAEACRNITNAIQDTETRLVHFSSDYVYHTYTGFPIREEDTTDPQGVYAQSKLEGEQIIRASGVPALIIRTSWVISSFGHNFVKTMLRLGSEKPSLNVVNDQYGAPTYARHLAQAVLDIITQVENNDELVPAFDDTYNYANEGIVTWYDIADRIMNEKVLPCVVHAIPTSDYPTPASRPHWSVLSKHKIKTTFDLEIPHWYLAVKECLAAIQEMGVKSGT